MSNGRGGQKFFNNVKKNCKIGIFGHPYYLCYITRTVDLLIKKTIEDEGITVDFWIVKVQNSN